MAMKKRENWYLITQENLMVTMGTIAFSIAYRSVAPFLKPKNICCPIGTGNIERHNDKDIYNYQICIHTFIISHDVNSLNRQNSDFTVNVY